MNFANLPIFILLFAFIYLSIIYGLLKIAENQTRAARNVISNRVQDVPHRVKTP
ncbi:MAG: hypothetical protein AAF383_00545 [Cyanobacteria bacterium P01_A01_bin.83]